MTIILKGNQYCKKGIQILAIRRILELTQKLIKESYKFVRLGMYLGSNSANYLILSTLSSLIIFGLNSAHILTTCLIFEINHVRKYMTD